MTEVIIALLMVYLLGVFPMYLYFVGKIFSYFQSSYPYLANEYYFADKKKALKVSLAFGISWPISWVSVLLSPLTMVPWRWPSDEVYYLEKSKIPVVNPHPSGEVSIQNESYHRSY